MITLDQILLLESRVRKAVDRIETLTRENGSLRDKLATNEQRIGELEVLISTFKEDQSRIEQGILNALEHLDQLEDEVEQRAGIEADSHQAEESVRSDENGRSRSHDQLTAPAPAESGESADAVAPDPESGESVDMTASDSGSTDEGDAEAGDDTEQIEESREAELDIF